MQSFIFETLKLEKKKTHQQKKTTTENLYELSFIEIENNMTYI